MKKRIINYLFVCLFATTMQTVSAQHTLIKEDFTFVVDEDHSMWTRVSANGTRQFYNNDDGLAVYHGDVILSGANIDNASFGGGANYAKETLNLKMDGKLHYEEGKLDGPFSIKYTFGNTADGKETNAYGRANRVRGRLNVTYSISGAFDKGYATGTWQISHERTEVTNGTKTSKYTITVKYDKGKIVSYVKNTNGEVVTLDKNGNVSGTIGKCNIRHGLELPNNDKIGDELAALMERGQKDSAFWKGIDYHYFFDWREGFKARHTFQYDILNSTIEGLFVKLGGIENPIAQFKGESEYYLQDKKKGDRYGFFPYNQLMEKINYEFEIDTKHNRNHDDRIESIYRTVHETHLYSDRDTEKFITSAVANKLQPFIDSLMKEVLVKKIALSLSEKIQEELYNYRPVKRGAFFGDYVLDHVGKEIMSYNVATELNDIDFIDSGHVGYILVPFIVSRPNSISPKVPETFSMIAVMKIDLTTRWDKIEWYPRAAEGTSLMITDPEKMSTPWDTIATMLNEWDSLMTVADKYNGTTPDFNKQLNLKKLNVQLDAVEDVNNYNQFLAKWLPKAKVFCTALPTDHEAYLLLKEIEGRSNMTPAISDYLNKTDYYANVKNEEQMTAQSSQLKRYYTDLLSYLNAVAQREPNHNNIIEKKKNAKNIVKIYNEYYLGIPYDWDEEMTALPALKELVEKQNKLLELLSRADIEDINKQVKKNKYKTVDEILSM